MLLRRWQKGGGKGELAKAGELYYGQGHGKGSSSMRKAIVWKMAEIPGRLREKMGLQLSH